MNAEATYHIIFIASNISDKIFNYEEGSTDKNNSANSSNKSDIIEETFIKIRDAIQKQKHQENIQYHICEWITNKEQEDKPIVYYSENNNSKNKISIDENYSNSNNFLVNEIDFYKHTFDYIKQNHYKKSQNPNKTIVIFLAHSFGAGYYYQNKNYISTLDFSNAMYKVFGEKGVTLFFAMNCSIMNIENCILFDHSVELFMGSQMAFFPNVLNYEDLLKNIQQGINDFDLKSSLIRYLKEKDSSIQNDLPNDIPFFSLSLIELNNNEKIIRLFNEFTKLMEFTEDDGRLVGLNAEILNYIKYNKSNSYDISTNSQLGWYDIIYALQTFMDKCVDKNLQLKAEQLKDELEKKFLYKIWFHQQNYRTHLHINGMSFHIMSEHATINLTNILKEIFEKYKINFKNEILIDWHLVKQNEVSRTFVYYPDDFKVINKFSKDDLVKNSIKITTNKSKPAK